VLSGWTALLPESSNAGVRLRTCRVALLFHGGCLWTGNHLLRFNTRIWHLLPSRPTVLYLEFNGTGMVCGRRGSLLRVQRGLRHRYHLLRPGGRQCRLVLLRSNAELRKSARSMRTVGVPELRESLPEHLL
jgi:hypothetical protein